MGIFDNFIFDEFSLLDNTILTEVTINLPNGSIVKVDAREDSHNSNNGSQGEMNHRGRIKVGTNRPTDGITFPVDYTRGGIRLDKIPGKPDKFSASDIQNYFDAACAISSYAKKEIKDQAKFGGEKNEKKLEKRLKSFNDLSNEEKEKYIKKGREMCKKDTIGKSKIDKIKL